MSAEAPRQFVDANILIYAHDASAGPKQQAAEQLLSTLWDTGTGCLSVQVLQEFFVVITRKVARPLPAAEAAERVRDYGAWMVFSPTVEDVLGAIALQDQSGIGFWDAMIVHAAAEQDCDVLWTEDLNDGQTIGGVRIRNPFVVPAAP